MRLQRASDQRQERLSPSVHRPEESGSEDPDGSVHISDTGRLIGDTGSVSPPRRMFDALCLFPGRDRIGRVDMIPEYEACSECPPNSYARSFLSKMGCVCL